MKLNRNFGSFTILLFVAYFGCIANNNTFGQEIEVSGRITQRDTKENDQIFIFEYQPLHKAILIDTCEISKNGDFRFTLSRPGLYKMQLVGGAGNDFYVETEKQLTVTGTQTDFFYGKAAFPGSLDNRQFVESQRIWAKKKAIQAELGSRFDEVYFFDPKYNTKADRIKAELENQLKMLDQQIDSVASILPNSFLSSQLRGWYKHITKDEKIQFDTLFDNDLAFQHEHFFENMMFDDPRLTRFEIFYERLDEYMANYIDNGSTQGLTESVGNIMRRVENSNVKSSIALYLSEQFREIQNPDMSEYILETYYSESCELALANNWADRVAELKSASVGSMAPEITLLDESGFPRSLSSIAEKKAIIIYFWSSRCQYCTEAMPKLVDFHRQFASQGFEVYAVSLDDSRELWKQYLNAVKTDWVNVCQGDENEVLLTYAVRGTPTYIVLDKEMRIQLRSHNLNEALDLVYDSLQ